MCVEPLSRPKPVRTDGIRTDLVWGFGLLFTFRWIAWEDFSLRKKKTKPHKVGPLPIVDGMTMKWGPLWIKGRKFIYMTKRLFHPRNMGSSIFTPFISGLQGPTFATENKNHEFPNRWEHFEWNACMAVVFHREDSQTWKTQKGPVVFFLYGMRNFSSFQNYLWKFKNKQKPAVLSHASRWTPFMNVAMAPPIALGWCIRSGVDVGGFKFPISALKQHTTAFQNKMAQKNRCLPDESAWPFVYPQTLGGHLYNLSTNCHFLSSPKNMSRLDFHLV